MGEALIGLLDSRQNAQTEIERGNASRIEARTPNCCAIARCRLERPMWIMRPVTGRGKSHAKPPTAM